ncbi:MAG: HEAT repeat domain-containing protein [bacterium]
MRKLFLFLILLLPSFWASEAEKESKAPPFKSLKIQVYQSYEEPAQDANVPFKEVASRLFTLAGVNIVPDDSPNYDALLTIKAEGSVSGRNYGKGGYYYTGVRLKGELTLEFSGKILNETFYINSPPWIGSPLELGKWFDPELYRSPSKVLASFAFGYKVIYLEGARISESERQRGAGEALARLCHRLFGVEPLLSALKDKTPYVALTANIGLSAIKDPASVPPLCEMLKNMEKDDPLRWSLIGLLGDIGDPRAEEVLLAEFNREEKEEIKDTIIKSLGKVKARKAVEPLLTLLKDEHTPIERKRLIIDSLGLIGDPKAIEAISMFIHSQQDGLSYAAINALGNFRSPLSAEKLVPLLSDKEINMSYEARRALAKIGAPALPVLFNALKKDKTLAKSVSLILYEAKLFDERITKDIGTLSFLLSSLKDEDTLIRQLAVSGLVNIGKSSVEPLIAFLREEKDEIALRYAASALRAITKQDFGLDPAKWQEWWKENKDKLY